MDMHHLQVLLNKLILFLDNYCADEVLWTLVIWGSFYY